MQNRHGSRNWPKMRGVRVCQVLCSLWMWVPSVAGCSSDLDCSLNGLCVAGRCECNAAWKGVQCEQFDQLPTALRMDIKELNVTTWGAGTLPRSVQGRYHLYAAEMVGNCGITTWQSNSQVVHLTSDTPTGPWTRQGVAIPLWAHCPSVAVTPNDTVVMWAFQGTRVPKTGVDRWGKPCVAGASPCGFAKHGCGPDAPPPSAWRPTHQELLTEGTSLPLLVSSGPNGPWRSVDALIQETVRSCTYTH